MEMVLKVWVLLGLNVMLNMDKGGGKNIKFFYIMELNRVMMNFLGSFNIGDRFEFD